MEWKMFLRINGRWSIPHLCDEENISICGFKYKPEDYTEIKVIGDMRPMISCDVCRVRELLIKDEFGRYDNANKYPKESFTLKMNSIKLNDPDKTSTQIKKVVTYILQRQQIDRNCIILSFAHIGSDFVDRKVIILISPKL